MKTEDLLREIEPFPVEERARVAGFLLGINRAGYLKGLRIAGMA